MRDIRYLEMGGCGRLIDIDEAQVLCGLMLVGEARRRVTSVPTDGKGWKVLADAEEQLALLVSL